MAEEDKRNKMGDIRELGNKVSVSVGLLVFAFVSVITATFSLTTIYNQFLLRDELIKNNAQRIEYVNGRVDKITKRNQERIEVLEDTKIKEDE